MNKLRLHFWSASLLFLVRCNALYQIKSYDPQLEKFTVNFFDFRLCSITCQVGNFTR